MRKKLLLIVFLELISMIGIKALANTNDVEVNETNFPDENFRNWILTNIDAASDGVLTTAELESIADIDCSEKQIQSLKGIEYFTSLIDLNCSFNQLASLDVSKNIALKSLSCHENKLTSLNLGDITTLTDLSCQINLLTSLDVSKNIALRSLSCYHNELTSLNLGEITTLDDLACGENQLTSLDVSKNSAITLLQCQDNQLTSLNLGNITSLTMFLCMRNQLTYLDIGNNFALTWLDCSKNKLESIDVSKMSMLRIFDCGENQLTSIDISNNTALEDLNCWNNKLTSLDVSKNTALRSLYIDDNQIASLDLSHNPALTYLGCLNNLLSSLDLSNNPALTSLVCWTNQLTTLDVSNNTALTQLRCEANQLYNLDLSNNTLLTAVGVSPQWPGTKRLIVNGLDIQGEQESIQAFNLSEGLAIPVPSSFDFSKVSNLLLDETAVTGSVTTINGMKFLVFADTGSSQDSFCGKKLSYSYDTGNNTAGLMNVQMLISYTSTSVMHFLTYIIDGEVFKTFNYYEGDNITPEPAPTKEGYTFSGWSEIPQTMPNHDVTITGTFTANKYKLTYQVDGVEYKTYEVEYGASITPEAAPTKEGYTFSDWSEIPKTMPAKDVTVTGTFTINKYKLTYMVDGEVYKTYEIEYGANITPEENPTKEGFTFSGWRDIPETMPAKDVTVTGSFTANKYKLTYMVDGEEYMTYELEYGSTITPETAPTKEGYTFSGWSEIPKTMPNHDVIVTGTFTINKYKLTYIVDGEVYKTYELEYGANITPEENPTKEGYTFSGWSEIPETMPAHDVEITGTFTEIVKAEHGLFIYSDEQFIPQLGFIATLGRSFTSPGLGNPNGLSPIVWTSSHPEVATVDGYGNLTINAVGTTQIVASFAGNDYYEAGLAEYSLFVKDASYDFNDDGTVAMGGQDKTGDVTIDATITINGQTFNVTAIAEDAFKDNQNITSVTIPEGITTIGNNAFAGCIGLIIINIGKDVQTIGSRAFANVGTAAVRTRSEENMLVVNCYTENVPQTSSDAFENTPLDTGKLLVNDNLVNAYKSTYPWSEFGNIYAFNDPAGINRINIGSENARIFDIQGNRLDNVRKGVNIIRTKDGKTKKINLLK